VIARGCTTPNGREREVKRGRSFLLLSQSSTAHGEARCGRTLPTQQHWEAGGLIKVYLNGLLGKHM
jgi:hypothetical protein